MNDVAEIKVTAMGYGQMSFYGALTKGLEEVELKTMQNEKCFEYYNDESDLEINSTQICANDPEELGRDTW